MTNRYLYFTVFVSGMTTLAVELTASRLLGVVFGDSNLVWASIIGLMLIYLTAGYFLGGRWADRSPHPRTFFAILAWGAFTAGLVPLAAKPVLPAVAAAFDQLKVGLLAGSFAGVLILFSVPVTLLGMISPFAIRLAMVDSRHAGEVAGKIYGTSTLGSFVGTFLPVLLLIPLVGTVNTFVIFSLLLVAVALAGLGRFVSWRAALAYAWMPLVLILLAALWANRPYKTTAGQIYETESAYNYIEVLQEGDLTVLRLNEGQGVHSVYSPGRLEFSGPWEQFLVAPFFNPGFTPEQVESMAIVGLAAGTTARQATAAFGPIPIDGFELDAKIIAVGREYFGMTEPNLNALAGDGRWGLAHSDRQYTLIGIDAYRPPYIPWHLTTREFFQIVSAHLTPDGAAVVNVGRAPGDRRLIDGLASTMGAVFPSIYVMDIPGTFNSILYATRQPTNFATLAANYQTLAARGDVAPVLLHAIERTLANRQPTPPASLVYTDDRAPIEWVTNTMVLNFLFQGGAEELR